MVSPAVSICHQTAADNMMSPSSLGVPGLIQCGETIHDVDIEPGHTVWSVRCPSPAGQGQTSPAEPAEDLDGATVGTIVVASLVGLHLGTALRRACSLRLSFAAGNGDLKRA